MLTSSGMRERHFLGKWVRENKVDRSGFLDDTYNPNQFYVQSTDVFRTLQSTYSELLGLFPPQPASQAQEMMSLKDSIESGKGMPPIKVR